MGVTNWSNRFGFLLADAAVRWNKLNDSVCGNMCNPKVLEAFHFLPNRALQEIWQVNRLGA